MYTSAHYSFEKSPTQPINYPIRAFNYPTRAFNNPKQDQWVKLKSDFH